MATDVPPLTRDVTGLAVLLATSGVTHLVRPEVFDGMVPRVLPNRRAVVTVSGVAELVCAAGLLVPAPGAPRDGPPPCSSWPSSRRTSR